MERCFLERGRLLISHIFVSFYERLLNAIPFLLFSENTRLKQRQRTGFKSLILIWEKDRYDVSF